MKPLIAVTIGDPAGVGPEIIAGAWPESVVHEWCRPLVIGQPEIIRRAVELWGTGVRVEEIEQPEDARPSPGVIPCLACGSSDALEVPPGTLDARAGQAAYDAIIKATSLALAGRVDAITTAPLQKEALHRAGHDYPGHTELLAHVCGVDDYAMMLYLGPSEDLLPPAGLAVVHVTLHTAMRNVFAQLTVDAILSKARLADRFMLRLMPQAHKPTAGRKGHDVHSPAVRRKDHAKSEPQTPRPRIGVCALNPHAGEGGLFGDEELSVIRPAVERGIAEGLRLEGPLPVDTLMVQARDGRFDAVVAMYHDQGHIALKLLGMHRAVNVTLGLPIIRTSVAHGTAFDIAWQRRAETGSLIEALRVASRLAVAKREEGLGA
ncbi:MAG: 4-hydroxythreonine-4-phosphate dehydrogenase PdxA [Planctomycetaceae bacterium]|nr:4-hydroxythreonine-4-phosphate dehydrogenase PdxA [Planctomycetaceae bacterium]